LSLLLHLALLVPLHWLIAEKPPLEVPPPVTVRMVFEGPGSGGEAGGGGGETPAQAQAAPPPSPPAPSEAETKPAEIPILPPVPRPPPPKKKPVLRKPQPAPIPPSPVQPAPPTASPAASPTAPTASQGSGTGAGAGSGAGAGAGAGTGASGTGQGFFGDSGGPGDDYLERVRRWIRKFKTYPEAAIEQKQEGRVVLSIGISRDGTVRQVSIVKSSGFPLLDEAAEKMVHAASPVPPMPPRYPGDAGVFDMPVDFTIGFFERMF